MSNSQPRNEALVRHRRTVRRRSLLSLAGFGQLLEAALSLSACGNAAEPESLFVERSGGQLTLAGEEFRFVGSNNYYQMYVSELMVDDVLETAGRAGFNSMRVWGSIEIGTPSGTDLTSGPSRDVYYQYWDGAAPAYNDGPNGLEHLDYVIEKAGELGLKLVIPLVNNWRDFGGMDQYVRWRDDATPASEQWFHNDFYTDPSIKGWYKDWVAHVLERVNPLTGVAYKDDPTIAVWELVNEPRCSGTGVYAASDDCSADTLVGWADEMTAHIKSLDANHLVSVGDEGFYCSGVVGAHWTETCAEGVDTIAFTRLPNVDLMSFHVYPDAWGTDAAWGTEWIRRHIRDARTEAKPSLLGEFGISDTRARDRVYCEWLDAVGEGDGGGALSWFLAGVEDGGALYPDLDGFAIYEGTPVFQTLVNFAQDGDTPCAQ